MLSKSKIFVVAAIVGLLIASAASATTWNIRDSFSTDNPNGVWTYGYRTPAESTSLTTDFVHQWYNWRVGGWTGDFSMLSNCQLDAWHVNSGDVQQWCSVNKIGPEPFGFNHTGVGNLEISPSYASGFETSVIRWTAPSAGTYAVAATFTLQDDRYAADARGSVAYVLKNGVALGSRKITGNYLDTYTYSGDVVTLNAGDTIEFAVNYVDLALSLAITGSIESAPVVPTFVTYQGKLTSSGGTPVADGDYTFIFKMFNVETDGTAIWTSASTTATVSNGLFTAKILGVDATAVPVNSSLWLELNINGETLTPRIAVGSDFFAIRAGRTTN